MFHLVYAHFSHGVDSLAMQLMYLTVLIFGATFYALLGVLKPQLHALSGYRLFTNLYNMGLAAVVFGQLIQGIVEIAGTGSGFVRYYYVLGITGMSLGIFVLALSCFMNPKKQHN